MDFENKYVEVMEIIDAEYAYAKWKLVKDAEIPDLKDNSYAYANTLARNTGALEMILHLRSLLRERGLL